MASNNLLGRSLSDDFFDAYSEGREDEARAQGMTYGVWSAILDESVCDYCEFFDGMYFSVNDSHPVPPAHFGCRCVVAYFDEEMVVEDGFESVDDLFQSWEDPPNNVFPPGTRKDR